MSWGFAFAGNALFLVMIWNRSLRRKVEKQTGLIAEKVERESIYEERQRIARELHDNLEQGLAGTAIRLRSSRRLLANNNDEILKSFESLKNLDDVESISAELLKLEDSVNAMAQKQTTAFSVVQDMLSYCGEESRTSIMDLRGGILEKMDLPEAIKNALKSVAEEGNAELWVEVLGTPIKLRQMVERNLLMVAREAAVNSVRHGKASCIEVELSYSETILTLKIKDNGSGFDSADLSKIGHFGVRGMRERINRLNGSIEIESKLGEGVEVFVTLPSLKSLVLEYMSESIKIMVVDDNELLRFGLVGAIEMEPGLECVSAMLRAVKLHWNFMKIFRQIL